MQRKIGGGDEKIVRGMDNDGERHGERELFKEMEEVWEKRKAIIDFNFDFIFSRHSGSDKHYYEVHKMNIKVK